MERGGSVLKEERGEVLLSGGPLLSLINYYPNTILGHP